MLKGVTYVADDEAGRVFVDDGPRALDLEPYGEEEVDGHREQAAAVEVAPN